MLNPKIALDQWCAFIAVVEYGGYAQAGEQIHKTQSSVSYAVQKIEQLLDIKLFTKQGRRAVLTPAGEVLYRRALNVVERAEAMERGATQLGKNWEPKLSLAVEIIFPTWLLLRSLQTFSAEQPQTRIQLYESVLGGTDEALYERKVDLALTTHVPQGFGGNALTHLRFIVAASPDHPLHKLTKKLTRKLTLDDLREHRHLVIRDSGIQRSRDSGGWFGADQRWTVSNKATQIAAACMGLGFAWFPEHAIQTELLNGTLKPLPMREGAERFSDIYLVFADGDFPTRSALRMAEILKKDVADLCSQ